MSDERTKNLIEKLGEVMVVLHNKYQNMPELYTLLVDLQPVMKYLEEQHEKDTL